jgi:hypothetical protein
LALLPRLPVLNVCDVIESGKLSVKVPVGVVMPPDEDVDTHSKVATVVALATLETRLAPAAAVSAHNAKIVFLKNRKIRLDRIVVTPSGDRRNTAAMRRSNPVFGVEPSEVMLISRVPFLTLSWHT